jgi:hypothetical protein
MGKRDDAIMAFKEMAERSTLQRRWLPTKAWVDAIDHAKEQTFSNKIVSTAINFICQSLGSKFSTTNGDFTVFHAQFKVNTELETIKKQTVHFYYVQPTTLKDKPKVSNDIRYWQQQYDKFSSMRQSNRKRKAVDDTANIKNPRKQPRSVDEPLSIDIELNVQLISKLLCMSQRQEPLQTSNLCSSTPQSFEEASTMLRDAWKEQHPHITFPEGYLTLEQIVEVNGPAISDEASEVNDAPAGIAKSGDIN